MASRIMGEDVEAVAKDISEEARILSGKTLLITGGAGFLGNYFISVINHLNKNFLEKPCKIISVDNFITGVSYKTEEGPNFKAIKHDIKNPLKVDEDVDFIIHAAGIASPKFYRKFKIETIDVATLGTKNMLELAKEKNVKSFLFFSSSEVYGDPDPNFVPSPETYFGNVSCTGPRSNYDESKRLGETLCIAYFETYKIPVKMVRPFNVFGPGMRLDDYRVIPNFISHVFQGKPIPVYGAGNNTRTFCYITDALTGFFKVLLSDFNGESFNVGNENDEINMGTLARIVSEIFDNKPKIDNVDGPTDAYTTADPKRRCPDLTKIKTKLNYMPKVDVKTGIKRFVEWAKESQA
jgi:nucleoside-diphosphate-sugar epimerase